MPIPQPSTTEGDDGLAAIIQHPAGALIALDFDGVIAPIVADPEQSMPDPAMISALRRLAPSLRGVAVITGRPALVAVKLGALGDYPELVGLAVFGLYGRERWDAVTDAVIAPPEPTGLAAARAALPAVLAASGHTDVYVEEKGGALAVHTRRAADPAGAFVALREPLGSLAAQHDLILEPGRFVLELRSGDADKGVALTALVAEWGVQSVLYAGDDVGDLRAFDAIDALRSTGVAGVKVCALSPEVTGVAERADVVVDGPPGVAALLEHLGDAIGAQPATHAP